MNLSRIKISSGFLVSIAIIVILTTAAWLFWADIQRAVIGEPYQISAVPTAVSAVDNNLKQLILSRLSQLRQYGQWPIDAVRDNPARGNPFEPKR